MNTTITKLQEELETAQHTLAKAEKRYLEKDAEYQILTNELEKTRDQIEHAHQEWIAALDVVEDPIFIHDKEFRILRCNRAYQQYAGLPFKKIIGHFYFEIFPKMDVPLPNCISEMNKTLSGGTEEKLQIGDTLFRSRSYAIYNKNGEYIYSLHTIENVTDKHRMEQALHDSEEKFRVLVESTSDWIWEIDRNGLYTYVSPQVEKLLGYKPEELMGKSPFDLMLPEEAEQLSNMFLMLVDAQAPLVAIENANRCKDGCLKILETSGVPFFDEKGEFAGYRGIDRDITERKEGERHLRESEERYRTLFQTMLNGFAYCRMVFEEDRATDFIYLEVNQAFEQQTGLKNVTGKRVSEVIPGIHESDPELLEKYGRVSLGGKPEQFETYLESLGMWFFISVYSPKPEHIVAVFDVITDRKAAEKALKNEAIRRKILMESSQDGIAIINKEHRIIEFNPRFADMLGYTPEEMLRLHTWDYEAIMNEAQIRGKFSDLSDANITIESRHRRKDGTVYDVEVSISGTMVENEPMVFTISRDITERKQAEVALNRANRALKTLSAGNLALVRGKSEAALLQEVTDVIVKMGGYTLAIVVYADENPQKSMTPMAWSGLEEEYGWPEDISWGDNEYGQLPVSHVIRSGTTHTCRDISCAVGYHPWKEMARTRGFLSNIALPLNGDTRTFGALCIYSSESDAFDEEEIRLLEELANDLAYGIVNLRTRAAHEQQALILRQSLEQSIQAIAATVEARDPYTAGHQRRVGDLATAIGKKMGLNQEQIEGIHFASIIHDLGKIHIPAEILSKPSRLTDIEYMLIQTHPQEGYEILKNVKFPWPIADIILQHHEKMDGTGYPRGLKSEEILLEAKIINVADVVEAMSSHRPYRPGLGIESALEEITRGRGSIYDPAVVDACLELFREDQFAFNHE